MKIEPNSWLGIEWQWRSLAAGILLCSVTGCGESPNPNAREVTPVRGTISFRGKPIPDATVRFHPSSPVNDGKPIVIPRGHVNNSGEFVVSTYQAGDGAPVGEYQLSVSWQGPLKGVDEDEEDRLKELLPRKYHSPKTSQLTFIVSPNAENVVPAIDLQ